MLDFFEVFLHRYPHFHTQTALPLLVAAREDAAGAAAVSDGLIRLMRHL